LGPRAEFEGEKKSFSGKGRAHLRSLGVSEIRTQKELQAVAQAEIKQDEASALKKFKWVKAQGESRAMEIVEGQGGEGGASQNVLTL